MHREKNRKKEPVNEPFFLYYLQSETGFNKLLTYDNMSCIIMTDCHNRKSMIKDTFLHLPYEKKRKILDAARSELERVPVHSARIARIIKDAGIPRGSFYQYFDTINDVFQAVLLDMETEKQNDFVTLLKKNKGGLFKAAVRMFEKEYDYFTSRHDSHLVGNLLNLSKFDVAQGPSNQAGIAASFLENMDQSRLHHKNPEALTSLLMLVMIVISENLRLSLFNGQSKAGAVKSLSSQLDIIRKGAETAPRKQRK